MINNNWIFGKNAGLDFSTTPPIPTSGNAINTDEGCASISDSNGKLLFYTDGIRLWDGNHILRIPNAAASPAIPALKGDDSSTQSAIIVPNPSNSEEYYVLTMAGGTTSDGASTITSQNHFDGVLLDVSNWTCKPISTLMTMPSTEKLSPAEKITAVQQENCKGYWVITVLQRKESTLKDAYKETGPGLFRIYEVNSSGIKHHIDINMGKTIIAEAGYLKSSADRTHLAIANYKQNNVFIYPFDNSAGVVDISGLKSISIDKGISNGKRNVYGIEFSPNSKLLYYATLNHTNNSKAEIYQVDFLNNLNAVEVTSYTHPFRGAIGGALQLGIDDQIYIARYGQRSLGAILEPNVLGLGCNVNNNYIQLPEGSRCNRGLPNLLPNACKEDSDDCNCDSNCGCDGCNEDAENQNAELIDRAKGKFNMVKANKDCPDPFTSNCERTAVEKGNDLSLCFSFHWGDSKKDQIEEHDTEVFYLTVCNHYKDISYNGVRITKVTLTPDIHPLEKIHIVPDRFVNLDCLEACTCKIREFAMITRANDTAGDYILEVEYCYDEIVIASTNNSGTVKFPLTITKD